MNQDGRHWQQPGEELQASLSLSLNSDTSLTHAYKKSLYLTFEPSQGSGNTGLEGDLGIKQ